MKQLLLAVVFLLSLSCKNSDRHSNRSSEIVTTESSDSLTPAKITLLFAGDLMQHKAQIDAARSGNSYDYSSYFQYIREEISSADIAIANLEVTLGGKPYRGYPSFSAPDEYLSAIKEAGFDVLLTANNHILDRGKRGLERTTLMLDSMNIPHAGSYKDSTARSERYPLILEKNGFRIAILNYTYGSNGLTPTPPNVVNYIQKDQMSRDIQRAKEQHPELIIACMHWGDEYKSLPNKEQKALADWLLSQGVTHIIGSHPHVVQPLELRTDSITGDRHVVVYSLGNLISNMSAKGTDGGILFKMEISKEQPTQVESCGYSIVWTARPDINHRKNYTLIPADFPLDSLSVTEQNKFKKFVEETRLLLNTYNKEVEEYIFHRKY